MEIKTHFASFAEAIREGVKLTPAGRKGDLIDRHGGTCALGAGAYATFGHVEDTDEFYSAIKVTYPYLASDVAEHPVSGDKWPLLSIVISLYDRYNWERERIAEWLFEEEERLGFITVIDTQDTKSSEASNNLARNGSEVCAALN